MHKKKNRKNPEKISKNLIFYFKNFYQLLTISIVVKKIINFQKSVKT